MSKRGEQEYLADMREAIQRIHGYTSGLSYSQFLADSKTQDAVIRNIEILGEAAKHLPSTLISTHPEIEWKSIAGMRDKQAAGPRTPRPRRAHFQQRGGMR